MKTRIYLMIMIVLIMIISQSCAHIEYGKLSGRITNASLPGESESYKNRIGAQAGIAFPVINFSDVSVITAGFNGSLQGANYEEDNGLEGKVSLFYVNLPFMFRYQTPGGFYGEAGIQPGLLLSAKDKYNGITDDYKDFIRKFDFGIPVGVGYEFKNNIGINIRLVRGLTNINIDDDLKDHNFVVGLGVSYTLKNNRAGTK